MTIHIVVKANAREPGITPDGPDGTYRVSVREPPRDGRANEAVCRAIARHFGVPVSRVILRRGTVSRYKTVDIL